MNATVPNVQCGEYLVLRVDGKEQRLTGRPSIRKVGKLIGARSIDTVTVDRARRIVMLVDDLGQGKDLPVNPRATELYHSICKPGTSWPIRGDVVLVNDGDFA